MDEMLRRDLENATAERDDLRARWESLVEGDIMTSDQQGEVDRLKTMLGQACDIADRTVTDRSDKAELARLRKATR